MAEQGANILTDVTGVAKAIPRNIFRGNPFATENILLGPGTKATIKASEEVSRKKSEAAINEAEKRSAEEVQAIQEQQAATKKRALQLAREESSAKRRGSPGRPILTSLSKQESILG